MSGSHEGSEVDRVRRTVARTGFVFAFTGLSFASAMFLLHQLTAATTLFGATFMILVALPAINVLAVLAEEVRRRDWAYVALAVCVSLLLAYSVASRL